jgi:hypothetical protein
MTRPSAYRRWRKARKRQTFLRSGMKPWTKGYDEHKVHEISRVLRQGDFHSDQVPHGYGFRLDERIIEYPWLFSKLPAGPGTLLDAGSVLNSEYLLDHPSLKSKKLHICTLAPESHCYWERGISYLFDDLRRLSYRSELFDWVACLSTLEHVGQDNSFYTGGLGHPQEVQPEDYLLAVRELCRVLKPGGSVYLSVPFGRAVSHGWFQVFDQRMIETVMAAFGPASHAVNYFLYKPEGWCSSNALETANATIFDIHHAKGYDPDFAAAARAVCCLELKK